MARPRIRSIKPEIWQAEQIGKLKPEARLLFLGLITMADDEGRLRASPSLLIGGVFPWDEKVTQLKVRRWLAEIEGTGLILQYMAGVGDSFPYLVIRGWRKHQKINRPSPSTLPEPPDLEIVEQNGLTSEETKRDEEGNEQRGRAIPERVRREVAKRAGAIPGQTTTAPCHYCGVVGAIHWARLSNGKPSSWVSFDGLELEHLHPFIHGGEHTAENLVLACPRCNRMKGSHVPGRGTVAEGVADVP